MFDTLRELNVNIADAAVRLKDVVRHTPLQFNRNLSTRYECKVYLKREDLQVVRSYKLRGAYNMMRSLPEGATRNGVVCASAGNHAQGFAYSCKALGIKGVVFMPGITPKQKINQTKMFGGENIEVILHGENFDDCAIAAKKYTIQHQMSFIPPFDHEKVIEGQGTIGKEILEDIEHVDYIFIPVGGGGLLAGVGSYVKQHSRDTQIIAVEPSGAPSLTAAFKAGGPITLDQVDSFVDGAAVKRVGDLNYIVAKEVTDEIQLVQEGKVCSTILELYNKDAIVAEPAGALSIAALDDFRDRIKGKNVVCIVSGSNNDIDRMPEIKERSLQFEGLKHYFLIRFAQKPGSLRQFLNDVLGPNDDIARFEYIHKVNKEYGPALVGLELLNKADYPPLIERMLKYNLDFTELNKSDMLFEYLV